jgi:hypothetical protein
MHAFRIFRCRIFAALAVLLSALATGEAQTVTTTHFNAGSWGASDATLGISGYTIETFESATLNAGVQIGWNTPAGNTAASSTLPNVFDPATDAGFGGAFATGAWDGTHGIINTRDNLSHVYTDVANWGNLTINFTTPVTSVGFSMEQMEIDATVFINGTNMGSFTALTGLSLNGGRMGYVRIDATGGTQITSIEIDNGRAGFNDGFMIDHLAFVAIPEPPVAPALLGLGAAAFAFARRRRLT